MNTVDLLQYGLDNAFGILSQVTADLTQEQANWQPPGIANPIGATYWHVVQGADEVVQKWCARQESLSDQGGWREKVLTVSAPEPEQGGDWLTCMRTIRVDLPALHEYAQAVQQAGRDWLGTCAPEDLERTVETPIGELNLAQLLEAFVIWHLNAHCGEISALKGCQGARGYPF